MKNIILLLLVFALFISCKDKFNPENFKGTWVNLDKDKSVSYLPYITFRNDSVFIEDMFTHLTSGTFKISRNKISYYLKEDTLNYNFNYSPKDSIITIGSTDYYFLDGFSYNKKPIHYELININNQNIISSDSLSKYYCAFHLFKDSKDSLKLKLNDKTTSDFNLIPRFAFQRHKPNEVIVIYLGKKITLKEIIKCYHQLSKINIEKALLLTRYDFKENTYSGFLDDFEIWNNQMSLFSREKTEPFNSIDFSRKKFLKKYSSIIIQINSENDFDKLTTNINMDNYYLIKINSEMSIAEYISLKDEILEIKKTQGLKIKTEFINLQLE